jgi:hypothetical protein
MTEESKEYAYCLRCGRKLKNEQAKKIGYGAICLKKLQTKKHYMKLFNISK